MEPVESKPVITDMRGITDSTGLEFVEPRSTHFMKRKSCIPNQVSSIFNHIFPWSVSSKNLMQHYCRTIKLRTELL